MAELQVFKGSDPKSSFAYYGDPEYVGWLIVPCGQHRDSAILDQSNHAVALAMLKEVDPDGNDHAVMRSSHWAVGWIEGVYVRPGSKCAEVAQEIADQLEDYPILDEEDFCRREADDYIELWDDYGHCDFRMAVHAQLPKLTAEEQEWLDDCDPSKLRDWYESLAKGGECCIHEDSGCSFSRCVERAVTDLDYPDFEAFMRGPEPEPRKDQPSLFDVN